MEFKTSLFMKFTVASLLILGGQSLLAQSAGTSGLTGTVTDPSGASVPNVTVTVTSADTNQSRITTTGANGEYKFTLLPPGNYNVKFAATGFKTSEVSAVTLTVTESPVLDRKLEVGAQSEQVTVEANAETLQTASSTLGTTVGIENHDRVAACQPEFHPDHRSVGGREHSGERRDLFRQRHAGYERERRQPGPE